MAEENVMDAVNAALGDAIDTPEPVTEEVEAPEVEETETPEGEGEPEAEGEPETEAEETDEEAEARGAERNPDGTFKKKEADKPAEPEKLKKDELKAKDPVNDPIPKDLKKETSERIRTLIDTTKTVTAERDEIKKNFDYMIEGVQATGTSPAQYGEMLSWMGLFNSNDPKQQEKALELVESVAERLATLLGKERTIGDPLAAHQDLKEAVAKGQVTAQYAKEIARTRNGQQFRGELTANASQAAQQQQAAQQEETDGRKALTELEATLMASDPDYAAKKAILVPALKPIMASIPWSQRKDKFLESYKALRLPKSAPNKGVPPNQPMRPKSPAGGQSKAPGSMLDAISGALAGMGK
jgi:hypothetical protein